MHSLPTPPSTPPVRVVHGYSQWTYIVLPFPKYHIVGIIQCVPFSDCLLSLSHMLSLFLRVSHGLRAHFFSALTFHCLDGPQFIHHPLKDILVVSRLWQSWVKLLYLGKYQGVWLLDCMGRVWLVLYEATKLPYRVAVPSTLPPAANQSPCCCTSSTASGVIRVLVSSILTRFFFKDFIYLLLERGEGRKEERERNITMWEKHWLVASRMRRNRTLAYNPGIELAAFCLRGWCSTNWTTPARVSPFR